MDRLNELRRFTGQSELPDNYDPIDLTVEQVPRDSALDEWNMLVVEWAADIAKWSVDAAEGVIHGQSTTVNRFNRDHFHNAQYYRNEDELMWSDRYHQVCKYWRRCAVKALMNRPRRSLTSAERMITSYKNLREWLYILYDAVGPDILGMVMEMIVGEPEKTPRKRIRDS